MINLKSNKNNKKNKTYINIAFDEEKTFLEDYLKSQQKLNTELHILLKQMVTSTVIINASHSKSLVKNLTEFLKVFKKSTFNISNLEKLLSSLHSLITTSTNFSDKLDKYNALYSKTFNQIVRNSVVIENFIESSNYSNKLTDNADCKETDYSGNNTYFENTLLISEIDDKVVLPYTIEDLNNELATNPDKYENLEDIINTVYTKPFKYYSHSSLMRFKEAFKLVREREHGSFYQALDLALELYSNYNLHPAIITACKTLNELDVYLSCLEYNELDDFHFFKTIFKFRPTALKTSKT